MATQKIGQLEAAARDLVGDGGNPNLFFVTLAGVVVTVTHDGDLAYSQWKRFQHVGEICALEDRKNGTLASRDRDDETGKIVTIDDYRQFIKKLML